MHVVAFAWFLWVITVPSPALSNPWPTADRASQLRVRLEEGDGAVRLRIRLSERIEPGSVQVQLAGRRLLVLARDAHTGQKLSSQPFMLQEPAVEEGAAAEYDRGRWLILTLRTQPRATDGE